MELTPPGPAVLATVFSYPHEKHIRAFCPVFDGQTPNGVSQQQLTNEVTFGPILGDVRLFSLGATGCYGLTGSTVRRAVPPTKTPVGPCMPGWRGQVRCLQTPQHCVVVAPYCWKSRLAGIVISPAFPLKEVDTPQLAQWIRLLGSATDERTLVVARSKRSTKSADPARPIFRVVHVSHHLHLGARGQASTFPRNCRAVPSSLKLDGKSSSGYISNSMPNIMRRISTFS